MNAYDLLQDVRDLLGEATASHWGDRLILRAINRAQKRIYMKMSMTLGDWFVTRSSALTPVAGVITPPSNYLKPVFIEEVSSGREVKINLSVRDKARTMDDYGGYHYVPMAFLDDDTIIVNNTSYTTPVYLWYEKRCKDLITGTAGAGSTATSMYLEDDLGHVKEASYYTDESFVIVDGTSVGSSGTIQDYAWGTRLVSLSAGSVDETSVYATVSILPNEAEDYLVAQAAFSCLTKAAGVVKEEFIRTLRTDLKDAKEAFFDWAHTRIKNSQYIQLAEGM